MNDQQKKEQLLSKHKQERKELRKECNDALNGKKGTEREEAERKNKMLTQDMEERHAKEVEEFMEKLTLEEPQNKNSDGRGLSKTQQRYQKKKDKEAKEEAERREHEANRGPGQKELEIEAIEKLLAKDHLSIKDIDSDGHCMYKAIAHQLANFDAFEDIVNSKAPHYVLRTMCAQYMLEHRGQFEPYLVGDNDETEPIEVYCDKLKKTAVWGGQLELRALSGALKVPIIVYTSYCPPIVMGGSYSAEPLKLTYHRHYLSLGEHYNSTQAVDES